MIIITAGQQQPSIPTGSSYLNEAELGTPNINFLGLKYRKY
jgi:hypothetical protein